MNIKIKHGGMISGMGEVADRIWRCIPCKDNPKQRWFWPINDPEPGAHVHFDPNDPTSKGYGGSTLDFHMETRETISVKGPWHGNTDSMFRDTGIDLRDQHLTLVILSKEIGGDFRNPEMVDVIYHEDKPVLGRFDRYKDIIQAHPEANYYYMESHGGSSIGPCGGCRNQG